MIDRRLFTYFDWAMLAVIASLAIIGYASIYSATHTHQPMIFKKDTYWLIIGSVFMIIAIFINYNIFERYAYFFYAVTILVLISVFFIGSSFGGAKRWISLGFFSLQPSEIAKLSLIMVLAKYLNIRNVPAKGMTLKDLVVPGLFMLLPFLLIAKQPDLGTGIILWMIFWSMVLVAKIRLKVLIGIFVSFAALAPIAWMLLKGYQKARLTSFLDPEADPLGTGYHVMQSKIAIGSGGVFGKGYLHGTQGKLMFLPEHHTDFIFAVLAEEWGLVGTFTVLALFLSFILMALNAANTAKDRFGFLLAFGITSMFFWQVTINIGMVSGILPVVGVPLPFISYGGSFLITSMLAAGILLNIKMRRFIF